MSIVYDIVTAAVIALAVFYGYRRGIIRMALLAASLVGAVVAAMLIANAAAPVIYDKYIDQRVVTAVKQQLEGEDLSAQITEEINRSAQTASDGNSQKIQITDEELRKAAQQSGKLSDNLAALAQEKGYTDDKAALSQEIADRMKSGAFTAEIKEKLPDSAASVLTAAVTASEDKTKDAIIALTQDDPEETAQQLSANIVAPAAENLIGMALSVVLFVIIFALLRMIVRISGILNAVPILGGLNRLTGALCGLLLGVGAVLLLAGLVRVFIDAGIGTSVFNNDIIDKTVLFGFFEEIKILN
ncbi:MAG: CvpA family protein [Oscillospiraceae bacterium]